MIALAPRHPAQMCLGAVLIGVEKAQAKGQFLFESICTDAADHALEVVDLLREIATDADYLGGRIQDAASDGVISDVEVNDLCALCKEISEEARTGRVI